MDKLRTEAKSSTRRRFESIQGRKVGWTKEECQIPHLGSQLGLGTMMADLSVPLCSTQRPRALSKSKCSPAAPALWPHLWRRQRHQVLAQEAAGLPHGGTGSRKWGHGAFIPKGALHLLCNLEQVSIALGACCHIRKPQVLVTSAS